MEILKNDGKDLLGIFMAGRAEITLAPSALRFFSFLCSCFCQS